MSWQRSFWFRVPLIKQLKRGKVGHGEMTINMYIKMFIKRLGDPVAKWLRAQIFDDLVSVVGLGSSPLWAHVRQAEFCFWCVRWFFLGFFSSAHLLNEPSHMS